LKLRGRFLHVGVNSFPVIDIVGSATKALELLEFIHRLSL
jgi:hypothetical protein